MRCPGQDRRYWTADAVFEVPCPECGHSVELFKDETTGRCTKCGHRFANPGIDFGCAQWCALAEQCLGLVPESDSETQATDAALAGRLIQEVSERFKSDPARLARSLKAFHYAKELLAKEGGDPRSVLAATLLWDLYRGAEDAGHAHADRGADRVPQILQDLGVEASVAADICELLDCYQTGRDPDRYELYIVQDAHTLNDLATRLTSTAPDELAKKIESQLKTKAARRWAGKWLTGRARAGHD